MERLFSDALGTSQYFSVSSQDIAIVYPQNIQYMHILRPPITKQR